MAHTETQHAHDAAHDDPEDFHAHVVPLSRYFGVFATLIILTVITVAVSRFDFGAANLVIALLVATTKAACVAAIFMHLAYDNKFNTVVLLSGLIFLAIFIGFTRFDVFERGRADMVETTMPKSINTPFDEKVGSKLAIPPRDHFRGEHKADENHQTGAAQHPQAHENERPH